MLKDEKKPIAEWKMPFGQYEGEELGTIYLVDKKYLKWVVKTFEDGPVKSKVEEFLEEQD